MRRGACRHDFSAGRDLPCEGGCLGRATSQNDDCGGRGAGPRDSGPRICGGSRHPMGMAASTSVHGRHAEVRPCVRRRRLRHGAAYCTNEYTGAALWLPPGVHPDEDRLGELMALTASPAARDAGPAIFEQMAQYHPSEPHWYLPLIGVDPAYQGRGHGDALMAYALERCDHDKLPAYLESTNPRNIVPASRL